MIVNALVYSYLTVEAIPSESLPTDTVIGAIGVLALSKRVTVEEVKSTLIIISTAILRLVFH